MSIAQLEVAGEGGFCRTSVENVNASVVSPKEDHADAAAFAALPTDETKLPWQIHHAQNRALSAKGIPLRARHLLAELARTVDRHRPLASIFAKRKRMSERAQLPPRTLCRALVDLEDAGLITRKAQRRLDDGPMKGTFDGVHLNLTEKAAVLLGLLKQEVAHGSTPASKGSDGSVDDQVAHGSFDLEQADDRAGNGFTKPHAEVAHGAYIRDLSPASQKRQPGQVPADLERLRSLGFREFLIFKLMREAREQGKRLSEVVEACWHGLKKANRPICYLQSLLRSNVDFGYQVRQKAAEQAAKRDAAAERDDAAAFAQQHAGETFVDAKGERLLVVDGEGQGASIRSASEDAARQVAGAWLVDFVRAVRSGLWRLADAADVEAFEQARRAHTAATERQRPTPGGPIEAKVTPREVGKGHLAALRGMMRGLSVPKLSAA